MFHIFRIILVIVIGMIVIDVILFSSLAKEGVLDIYNVVLKNTSTIGLSKDNKLEGERQFGIDEYVGTYKANYNNKTKEETIFGGTVLEREYGNTITLEIKVEKQNGSIEVISNLGTDSEILINDTGEIKKNIDVKEKSYYLKVKVKDFTGNIEIIAR